MNRRERAILRSSVGFAVGFGVALATIVVTESSRSAQAPSVEVVGEIDFFEYCRTVDTELSAALRSDDAFGWRCVGRRNGIFGFDEIDVDAACRLQYGELATAATTNPSSPYAWRCVVRS